MAIEDATFLVQRGAEHFSCVGSELINNLQDGDMMLVQRGDEIRTWLNGKPIMPWTDHPGGVFHIINGDDWTLNFDGTAYQSYDLAGNDLGTKFYLEAGEEVVIVTGPEPENLFKDNDQSTWLFGSETDVSRCTKLTGLFWGCTLFNGYVGNWDISNVTDIHHMFYECENYNQDVSNWDTGNVKYMHQLFYSCKKFNQDLSKWCVALQSYKPSGFDQFCDSWVKRRPVWTTCPRHEDGSDKMPWEDHDGGIFHFIPIGGSISLSYGAPFTAWDKDGTNERQVSVLTSECIFITPKNCDYLFAGSSRVQFRFGVQTDVSKVTSAKYMFSDKKVFTDSLLDWDVSNIVDMEGMFNGCTQFNSYLGNWCVTKIKEKPYLFDQGARLYDTNQPKWGTCPRGEDQ